MATQFVTRTMRAAPRVACATRKAITRTSTLSSTAYQREIEFSPAPTSPPWRVGASSHAGDSTLDATSQRSNLLAEASPLVSMAFQEHEESVEQDCSAADSIADLRPLYENSTRGLECGDLRLGQFMEEVKTELWQYNAMPFRKRFRVQSLLRRLQTPPFETWTDSLIRATDSCTRPITRTLLARHEGSPSLPSSLAPGFELLLLCWKPGGMSAIHDHPNSGCWVKVLKGQIREKRYCAPGSYDVNGNDMVCNTCTTTATSKTGQSGLVEISDATHGAGTVTYIEDSMGYHKMENASSMEECISLHLYSPGISTCNTWSDSPSFSKQGQVTVSIDDSFVAP